MAHRPPAAGVVTEALGVSVALSVSVALGASVALAGASVLVAEGVAAGLVPNAKAGLLVDSLLVLWPVG